MDISEITQIRSECAHLLVAFGQFRDDRDSDGAASVMAPDGVWDRDGTELKGPEQVRKAVDQLRHETVLRHVLTNVLVDVIDSTHAKARAYYTVFRHDGPAGTALPLPRPLSGPTRMGDYEAKFVKLPEGWRISYAVAKRVFSN